jgi:thiosulfate/3-mercaptopyruvate sulfurtransferase
VRRLGSLRVLDARAPERFRGEVEPIDPVAGHIPGALNRFHRANLDADGRFKPAAQLRAEYEALLGSVRRVAHRPSVRLRRHRLPQPARDGTGRADRLGALPGSWSEWSADPARPIAAAAKDPRSG